MTTVLLVIHVLVTLALIGVVLIQRSEGGGLGIGTSQGMGGLMTGRGTANLLTRTTSILATIFFGLSLTLALLNRGTSGLTHSILDTPPAAPAVPGAAPAAPAPGTSVPGTSAPATPAPASPASAAAAPAQPPAPTRPAVPNN